MLLNLQYLPTTSRMDDDDDTRLASSEASTPNWQLKSKQRTVRTTTITPDKTSIATAATNTSTFPNTYPTPTPSMRILRAGRPTKEDGWHKIEKRRKTKMTYRLCKSRPGEELQNGGYEKAKNSWTKATTTPKKKEDGDCWNKGGRCWEDEQTETTKRRVLVRRVFVRTSLWGNHEGLRRKRKRKGITSVLVSF